MLEHYITYIRLFGAKNSGIDTQLSERSHKLSKEAFNRTNKQFGTTSRDMLRVVLARNVIKDFCKIRNIALDGIQEEENLEKEDDVEAVLVDEEENVLDEEGAEEAKVVDEDEEMKVDDEVVEETKTEKRENVEYFVWRASMGYEPLSYSNTKKTWVLTKNPDAEPSGIIPFMNLKDVYKEVKNKVFDEAFNDTSGLNKKDIAIMKRAIEVGENPDLVREMADTEIKVSLLLQLRGVGAPEKNIDSYQLYSTRNYNRTGNVSHGKCKSLFSFVEIDYNGYPVTLGRVAFLLSFDVYKGDILQNHFVVGGFSIFAENKKPSNKMSLGGIKNMVYDVTYPFDLLSLNTILSPAFVVPDPGNNTTFKEAELGKPGMNKRTYFWIPSSMMRINDAVKMVDLDYSETTQEEIEFQISALTPFVNLDGYDDSGDSDSEGEERTHVDEDAVIRDDGNERGAGRDDTRGRTGGRGGRGGRGGVRGGGGGGGEADRGVGGRSGVGAATISGRKGARSGESGKARGETDDMLEESFTKRRK